ncbi:DUF6302 family protein [Streptomyces sp. NPDC052051]
MCHVIQWGEDAPADDDAARGEFYGYTTVAIRRFAEDEMALW